MTERFGRDLIRGSLDMMIMSVLAEGSQYGYSLQKRIRAASGDRVDLAAGTLYPLLHKLEQDKLIRSRWDSTEGRRRKWYDLTTKGRKRLTEQAKEWTSYAECLSRLLAPIVGAKPA
ncbi:MAG: PadR family transcriptional regulator [Pirellulales bacterium]|nr:PadR family transcriptional regulator [Pirellulales bacterium]